MAPTPRQPTNRARKWYAKTKTDYSARALAERIRVLELRLGSLAGPPGPAGAAGAAGPAGAPGTAGFPITFDDGTYTYKITVNAGDMNIEVSLNSDPTVRLVYVNPSIGQDLNVGTHRDINLGAGQDFNLGVNRDINLRTGGPGRDVNIAATRDLNFGATGNAYLVGGPLARLSGVLIQLNSSLTGDNGEFIAHGAVDTTGATQTLFATFDTSALPGPPTDQAFGAIAFVAAARHGGASGTGAVGDGLYAIVSAAFKNVAGTLTQIGTTDVLVMHKDASFPATPLAFAVSGQVIQLKVTGEASASIFWQGTMHLVGGG